MNAQPTLEILIGEFNEKLTHLSDLIVRNARFPEAPGKIKVAIGMRRSGKTYFLYQQILKLLAEGIDRKRILYLNFEDDRLFPLNEKKLAEFVDAFYSFYPENHDRKCYLFFDEIQNVENWAIVIRRLHDTKNGEIFLTGSSAKLLSKEIATSLRGRSLAVEIWPYSFTEFKRAKNMVIDSTLYDNKTKDLSTQAFHQYISEGGFPEIISFAPDVQQRILQEYLDLVVFRDIIERHKIGNPSVIKYMILSMTQNVAKPFSVHKFYQDLKSQGYQIGKDLLYEYLDYIEDAYLAFSVPLYDLSIRKVQTNPKKIYAVDPGMVRSVTLNYDQNLGRLFENIVYLDLRRQGYRVNYYLTAERYEIDFLAESGRGEKKFFQVAWDITDPKTLEREQRALEAGMKELGVPGELITVNSYLRKN